MIVWMKAQLILLSWLLVQFINFQMFCWLSFRTGFIGLILIPLWFQKTLGYSISFLMINHSLKDLEFNSFRFMIVYQKVLTTLSLFVWLYWECELVLVPNHLWFRSKFKDFKYFPLIFTEQSFSLIKFPCLCQQHT